jgi:phosphoglycerate kinase
VLLENLRFDPGEEADDPVFAGRLADLADGYVDDAFGAAHRAHASVSALPELMLASGRPAVAGRLMQREVEVLARLLHDPARPYVAILGGAKVGDKLGVIEALIDRVDALLIGGAMAFTLIAAAGGEVGNSLVERERFDEVRAARARASERGVLVEVPQDVVAAAEISSQAERRTVPAAEIPRGLMGLDIGPKTVEEYSRIVADAKTILWNGPMGVFELEPFSAGTRGVATAVAHADAFSVVGGGDSLLAVKRAELADAFDHLSTGGGASLEFLEGRALPGIAILEEDR